MKNTKKKILESALIIFNENGYRNTTLRKIATSLGISQGNLNYHYKTKGELLEELYFNLVELMGVEMKKVSHSSSMLRSIFDSSKVSMNWLYRYRFLMRDFHTIMTENGSIRMHYEELQTYRSNQFMELFENLIEQGIMREEEFKNEYKRLYARMNILGDNWINTQELLNAAIEQPVIYYRNLLFEVIYPYLTTKGKMEFYEITGVDNLQ